ncbi:phage major capsid protein [Caballeronia sp. BCC1704]|uniref:phage major capsid protein n=1 Tax=Caballeronia sp. BCC1704 TaxID=2676300 RepID=UPI00158F1164|nr:phage major capsid protein [Caballeronia sp. BCC1704]
MNADELRAGLDKISAQVLEQGKKAHTRIDELQQQVDAVEKKFGPQFGTQVTRRGSNGASIVATKSIGSQIKGTQELEMFRKGSTPTTKIALELKSIVSDGATPSITPFAQTVPGIQAPMSRRLTVESMIPSTPVDTGAVQWLRETAFTNNAAAQKKQLDTKAESDIKFENKSATIATIAHFVTASKQVLDDQNGLQAYIEQRLLYGLDLATEDQLLNGDGAEGDIGGLLLPDNHTAFNATGLGKTTPLDYLRRAKTQLQKAFFIPSALIINPADAETIDLLRDDEGRFLVAPGSPIWGMAPVVTEAIGQGAFIVADFVNSAVIWDREDATLQLGYVNDQFIKNAITLLVERRLQMSVTRPGGIVYGTFAATT